MVMVNIYDEITMLNIYDRKMCHDHWEFPDARGLLASVHSSPEGSLRRCPGWHPSRPWPWLGGKNGGGCWHENHGKIMGKQWENHGKMEVILDFNGFHGIFFYCESRGY